MAYVKHLAIRTGTHILNSIKYVKDEKKAISENVTGINCDVNRVNEDFEFAKIIHDKTDTKIIAHHFIQSFKPGEATEKKANEIGCKLINEIAPGYQAIVVTHSDKDHIHNHIIINSVNINTGYMFKANKDSLNNARNVSDDLCKEYNLSIINENTYNKGIDQATYNLALQGKSWKVKMLNAIDEAIMFNDTKEGFIKYLEKQGYEVKYQNKNISLKDPQEQKKFIRVDTLGRQFGKQYSMKGIEARLKGEEFENGKLYKGGEVDGIGGNRENRTSESNEQNGNREDNINDTRYSGKQHQDTSRGTEESRENNRNDRRKKRKYTTEKDRYDKWKSEQERSIKKGIDLEHIDNQLFKLGKALGSISPTNNKNKDTTKDETFKVFMAIILLFLKSRKNSKLKKAQKMRYKVLRARANLRIGNTSYESMNKLPGENKYIKLNITELEKLRNESTFNYTGIIKDNKITIMVKENDLDKVLNLVGRKFEKQYGNTTYKYIKEHSDKIEFRIIDSKLLEKLKDSDLKFACFKKGDKFNISFANNDLAKYINITKAIKEKER